MCLGWVHPIPGAQRDEFFSGGFPARSTSGRGIEEGASPMSMVREIDYGTQAVAAEATVTLTIDGRAVTVPEGTSVMRASMEAGIKVPRLCATDMLDSFGSCRLCL